MAGFFSPSFFSSSFFNTGEDEPPAPEGGGWGYAVPMYQPSTVEDDDDIFLLWFALLSRNG